MKKVWGIFWIVIASIGSFALYKTWQLPSEAKNALLLGMSKSKLALCGGMILLVLISLTFGILSFTKKESTISSGKTAGSISFILLFLLTVGYMLLTPPIGKTSLERSLSERLLPFGWWSGIFILLSTFLLILQKFTKLWRYQTSSVSALIWGGVILILMSGCFYIAVTTGLGLESQSRTFYRQGVSLLEGHLLIPLFVIYLLLPVFSIFEKKISGKKAIAFSVAACIVIWCITVWLWQTTDFEGRSYFAPALRPPNYNFYPSSDAENYDLLAQSVLLGNGFRNGLTVVRPLYAAFLALLHFIFGNDYMLLTNGQIVVLALIPMLVFLIGKHLRHTAAGLVVSAWIIWREIYSIRVTHLVQVSNSRLLMSDLPTMLLVVLIIFCVIKWYKRGQEETRSLLCGGMVGTAMLLRTQCFVLIPDLWIVFLFSKKNKSQIMRSVLFSVIGLAIVFLPWTIWQKIHPNDTVNKDVSEDQYLVSLYRTAAEETDKSKSIFQLISEHPLEIIRSISSHFLNNEISSFLILPVRLIKPIEAEQLIYDDDLFWYRENARETIENNLPLISVYLLIVSFGVITAVRKNGFGGLIPFLFHIVYNLGNAFALTSGFRFILPVDWVIFFYFGLGAIAVFDVWNRLSLFDFRQKETIEIIPETEVLDTTDEKIEDTKVPEINTDPLGFFPAKRSLPDTGTRRQVLSFTGAVLLLTLIGALLPLCEKIIPRHFSQKTSEQIKTEWIASDGQSLPANLSQYNEKELVYLEGRAFYPRFYKAGEGDSGGSSIAKRGLDYDRLVWMFHDQQVHVLCCPLTEEQVKSMTSLPFPDPIDVVVVGIPKEDYVEVLELRRIITGK